MIRRQLPAFSPLPLGALIRSMGPSRGRAEAVLRRTIRARFAVEDVLLCGSGTQALQLALEVARNRTHRDNDLVALPAFTCYDVASAAIGAKVRVVFYDVDPESLAPDLESLAQALQRGPAAVVIAPLYGYQPDWDTLRALTTQHDVMLVEDAAQSFGARWRGRSVGGLGDLSILSFGRGKGWTAVSGGALLGPGRDLAPLSAALPPPTSTVLGVAGTLFRGLLQWGLGRPVLYGVPSMMPGLSLGETVFHPPVAPCALGPGSVCLALETAEAAELEAEARRARAEALTDRLNREAATGFRVPQPDSRSEAGSLRLPVLAPRQARTRVLAEGRPLGIMPSYPRPLPELRELESRITGEGPYPGAEALAETLVTVPTHSLVSRRDIDRIVALLRCEDV